MTRVRLSFDREREFDLVHFNPTTSEWTLGGEAVDLVVFESDLDPSDVVEVRCDLCGRWSTDAAPSRSHHRLWICFGGTGECAVSEAASRAA